MARISRQSTVDPVPREQVQVARDGAVAEEEHAPPLRHVGQEGLRGQRRVRRCLHAGMHTHMRLGLGLQAHAR